MLQLKSNMINQLQKKLEQQRKKNFENIEPVQSVEKQQKPVIAKVQNNAFQERKKHLQMFFAKQQGASETNQLKSEVVPVHKEQIKGDRDNFLNARKLLEQQMGNKNGSSQPISSITATSTGSGLPPPPSSIQISSLPPPPPPPPLSLNKMTLPLPPPPPPPPSLSNLPPPSSPPSKLNTISNNPNLLPTSLPNNQINRIQSNQNSSLPLLSSINISNVPPPPPSTPLRNTNFKIFSHKKSPQHNKFNKQQFLNKAFSSNKQQQYYLSKQLQAKISSKQQIKISMSSNEVKQDFQKLSSQKPKQYDTQSKDSNRKQRKKIFEMKSYQPLTSSFFGKDIAGFVKREFIKENDILGVIGIKVQRNRVPENFHFPSIENKHREIQGIQTLYVDKDYLDVIAEYRKKNLNAIRPHNNALDEFKKMLQNYDWRVDKFRLKPIKNTAQNVPNIGNYKQLNLGKVKKSLQRCQLLKKLFSDQENYAMCEQIKNIRNETQDYVQKYINDPQRFRELFLNIENNMDKIERIK